MSKAPRGDFALSGGRFPMNTEGRKKAAPGLAAYSHAKGNITAAEEAQVDRAAGAHPAAQRGEKRSEPLWKRGMK